MPSDSPQLPAPRHPMRRGMEIVAPQPVRDDSDLKLFVLSFTAFFVAIYCFIA